MTEIPKTTAQLPKVELVSAKEVAALLKTSAPKIHAAVLNGTLPVGFATEGSDDGKNRTIIVKERLIAWLTAQDLKGG